MRSGRTPPSIRRSRRSVSSLVLPEPAEAPTKAETAGSEAASWSAWAWSRAEAEVFMRVASLAAHASPVIAIMGLPLMRDSPRRLTLPASPTFSWRPSPSALVSRNDVESGVELVKPGHDHGGIGTIGIVATYRGELHVQLYFGGPISLIDFICVIDNSYVTS